MTWLLFIFPILIVVISVIVYKKREAKRLQEENKIRGNLGLPSLTLTEYRLQPIEKSADYRHHINQHM